MLQQGSLPGLHLLLILLGLLDPLLGLPKSFKGLILPDLLILTLKILQTPLQKLDPAPALNDTMFNTDMMIFNLLILILINLQFGDGLLELLQIGLDLVFSFEVGIDDGVEEAVVVADGEEVGLSG